MVLQKRLDYGFNGYQVPPMPRATRSARKRRCFRKRREENQMCAFDLLAIVAGKLLLDNGGAPSSSNTSTDKDQCPVVNNTVKNEWQDEEKPLKVEEACDQGSTAGNFFVSTLSQVHRQVSCPKESVVTQNDCKLELASALTSDHAERANAKKLENEKGKNEIGVFSSQAEGGSSGCSKFGDYKLEVESKREVKDEPHKSGKVLSSTVANMFSLEDSVVMDAKPFPLVSSDSSAMVPPCGHHIPDISYPTNWDDVNVVSRDDDENSGCTHPISKKKFFMPTPQIGDRRIRKILASKYWKVAPRVKDVTLSNSDGDLKPVYCKRNNYYRHQRSERIYPFKKRKHFDYCSPSNSNGGMSCEFVSDSSPNGNKGDASGSSSRMHGAAGASSSLGGQHTSFQPRDSHVKLRIKSFRVPELLIEIPESSTVGSLKRTVMDAVTAILGGGLRVGVLLQGKKVRDDNRTLLQTGISHNDQLDALGFCLEPNPSQTPPSLCPGDSTFLLKCDARQPISRYPSTTRVVQQGICAGSPQPHANNLGNCIESDHDSAPSPNDTSMENSTNSKALVAVPAMNVEALAVVPANRKPKRSEIVQRRIRRPFSVAEVEALVQAVEKLGTGRWRDVKLQAFDNAKHRTYVDLKDKWKTLVHTAKISPQQRRGEPVPQELLDRVLTAHAYWSQKQAKHQQPEICEVL